MDERAPVFVKVDEYQAILDVLGTIRQKLDSAKALLDSIKQLQHQEDQQVDAWSRALEEVEEHLANINKSLSEPKI